MTHDGEVPGNTGLQGTRPRWRLGRKRRQGKPAAAPRPAGLVFEPLEPRILLSADPGLLGTTALSSTKQQLLPPPAPLAPLVLSSPDPGPPVTIQANAVDPAPPVQGSIDVPGQANVYTFTLTAPKSVYFDSLTPDNSLTWTLSGPRGTEVDHRAFGQSDGPYAPNQPALQLLPGSYKLSVAGSGDHTGGYSFRLLDLGTAQPVTPGTQVSDTLTPGNAAKAYQFTGTAGERVFLDAQSGSGLYWRLLDPNGQTVGSPNYFADQQMVLPLAGSYTLVIEGANDAVATAAPYAFTVHADADTSAALTLGATTSGAVTQPGQLNHYSFTLAGQTRLVFDSLSNDSSLNWTLTGPAGTVVSARSFAGSDGSGIGGSDLLDLAAGSYALTVAGSADHTAQYGFRLLDLASATPVGTGTAISGTLDDAGRTTSGTVPGVATRLFAFSATRGDQVTLTVPTATYGAYYRLYDPTGQLVATDALRTG